MKKSLIATLVAVPLLSLSSMAFAVEPLTASQMDGVTAGFFDIAKVSQYNYAPIKVTQANVFTNNSANVANITSGNFSTVNQ